MASSTTEILAPTKGMESLQSQQLQSTQQPGSQKPSQTILLGADSGASGAAPSTPQAMIAQIQHDGQQFVNAINANNVAETTKWLSKSYKEKAISGQVEAYLRQRSQHLKNSKSVLDSASVGVPGLPQSVGGTYVSFVPVRMVYVPAPVKRFGDTILFAPKSVTLDCYLVATSTDSGKTWGFFEAEVDRSITEMVLPEIAPGLVFPAHLFEMTPH